MHPKQLTGWLFSPSFKPLAATLNDQGFIVLSFVLTNRPGISIGHFSWLDDSHLLEHPLKFIY